MKNLKAIVNSSIKTINSCNDIYSESLSNKDLPYLETGRIKGSPFCYIEGNPQAVMALIGLLADHGEDSLISVKQV